ncbi:MAG: EF-hand domain-containing protein [Paludisphaera borealis]|uniref:EF-hand domain-containing protein n=1 Tax=Paludisphaera borealis TaxID=1387353 RepID=UPI00283FAB60|nr:EF-hand domain-containing protein [Paludisphaera borealis]MDR3619697.1 EF-hand domain-containing protein [Paludisphaera borealis]
MTRSDDGLGRAIMTWFGAAWFASAGLAGVSACAGVPAKVTFTEHVAPIVFENCAGCHRPDQGAPFTLLSYRDVQKRGEFLRGVIADREMPPWPPAHGWSRLQDDRRLSDDQIATFDRWVETGMEEGPADKLPKLPPFVEGGWTLGEPDLIVTLPEAFDVPADGPDIYRMFVLPLNLSTDQWVTAVEIHPTARSVVHHALYFLDDTGASRKLDEADPKPGFGKMGFPRTGTLGGWALGATTRRLPMGLAYPLSKGSDLVVQIHFHPSGKAERERASFGLYFAKEKPKKRLMGFQAPTAFGLGTELRTRGIQPGEKDFTIHGEWTAPFDVDLVSVGGHAHYRCKSMKAVVEAPDGREEKLFAIDDWDFRWQGRYNYAEPVRLAKGSVVRTTLVYDNSADNPRNPSIPPILVRWGEGTNDEMGSVNFAFVAVDEANAANYRGATMRGGSAGGGGLRNLGPAQRLAIFRLLDADRDGKLKGDEIPERMRAFLDLIDVDHDGAISREEVESLPSATSR